MGTGFELPDEGSSGEAHPAFGSVRRGYDPREVEAFLAHVASGIRNLGVRSREAVPDTPDDVDARLAERFARILALQEHEAEDLVAEAHVEAAAKVAEAKQEADRIRSRARDAAERSVKEAGAFREQAAEEADHLRSDLVERRRAMIEGLPQIQQRLLKYLQDVEATLGTIGEPSGVEPAKGEEVVDEDSSTD